VRRGPAGSGKAWSGKILPKQKAKEKCKMVYEWRGHSYNVPAQTVGEKLETIEKKYGEVTNQNFLDESRAEDSATHSLFEWDDAIAGERWRLSQARTILSCVHIVVRRESTDKEQAIGTVRAYVNKEIDDGRPGGYVAFHKAFEKTSDYQEIVIQNATRELKEFADRNRKYEKFSGVIREIDAL